MNPTRRSLLKRGAGVLAAGTLAGCTEDLADEAGEFDSGYAAFFTLWDWTEQIAGDRVDFENPIEVGQMGHGWEPPGDIAADIAATDAFVYLDSPEFSWAQDVASTLESDYDDVAVIDGMAGLDDQLLEWDAGHDGHGHDDDHHDDDHGDDHHDDHDDDHHDDDHDDHDHGYYDPHVWVDPVLAGEMVDTIADGLVGADPDNAEAYLENAEAYREKLAAVDDAFEEMTADADRDVAVLAGHDSFQYLEHRYGFRLHSPVGVSPEEEPSSTEIADTIEFVDENGIDVILYDHFDSPNLAEQIVENSDASEAVAISPAEGTTEEWRENDWGYLEQMMEINVPAFRRALGAE